MRWRRGGALALPFLLGALTLRFAIAPIGDAIAGGVGHLAPRRARTAAPGFASADVRRGRDLGEREPGERERDSQGSSEARRASSGGPTAPVLADGGAPPAPGPPSDVPKATIVVPASAVARAMQRRDVGATNAAAADGSPLGARLVGVSRYRTGLRDGDVVVSVAGTRTPTVAAMVAAAMQAASGGATRLSGRIVRGETTFAVVIELPQ